MKTDLGELAVIGSVKAVVEVSVDDVRSSRSIVRELV